MSELQRRWQQMFAALAASDDLPPGERYRAEGLMEAVLLAGEADETAVDLAMQQCYLAAFGRSIEQDFGDDWRDFYPFPQIPAVMRRAPVYPSTSD